MRRLYQLLLLALLVFAVCIWSSRQLPTPSFANSISDVRIVKHAMGETKIPVSPQRIVALDPLVLEIPLALGVKLVGAPARYLDDIEQKTQQSEIADIGWPCNIEKVLALKPDLILGSTDQNRDTYSLWSQIAPTILVKMDNNGDWKKPFKQIAKALEKTAATPRIVDQYNASVTELKAKIGERLEKTKVSVIRINPPATINLLTQDLFSGVILDDSGLSRPRSQQIGKKGNKRKSGNAAGYSISRESLNQIDGDILFVIAANSFQNQTEFQKAFKQLQKEPLWSKLKVAQQNKVYIVGRYWLSGSYLSANRVLDDLFKYLVQNSRNN